MKVGISRLKKDSVPGKSFTRKWKRFCPRQVNIFRHKKIRLQVCRYLYTWKDSFRGKSVSRDLKRFGPTCQYLETEKDSVRGKSIFRDWKRSGPRQVNIYTLQKILYEASQYLETLKRVSPRRFGICKPETILFALSLEVQIRCF